MEMIDCCLLAAVHSVNSRAGKQQAQLFDSASCMPPALYHNSHIAHRSGNKPRTDCILLSFFAYGPNVASVTRSLLLVFHILGVAEGPNKRGWVSILQKEQVSCRIQANVCAWHPGWWCVCLCRASQQCPSACTSEKEPCINRTPTDTIFSEGDAFQLMCWWMTTGWRCDFEAPNVLRLTTCACQYVSSPTLGGGAFRSCHTSTVESHLIRIGLTAIQTDFRWAQATDLADFKWFRKHWLSMYTSLFLHQCVSFFRVSRFKINQKQQQSLALM